MPAEIQPLLAMEQPVRWGDVKTCTVDYNEAPPFFALERQGLIRFICVTVKLNPGRYECVYLERISGT